MFFVEFDLASFSYAFQQASYSAEHSSFSVFAFILATPVDKDLFPKLLSLFYELDTLTGQSILLIAPRMRVPGSETLSTRPVSPKDWIENNSRNVSKALAVKGYYSSSERKRVDLSHEIDDFLERQMKESYSFARYVGLDLGELPCILFFDNLRSPTEYVLWPLQGASAEQVIIDFREIVATLERDKQKNEEEFKPLQSIHYLNRKQFIYRVLSQIRDILPLLKSLIPI